MATRSNQAAGKCPVTFALDMFGDKWTLLLVRDMLLKGKRHYGDFLKSSEGISTNILADRLEKLERNGFVTKQPDTLNARKVVYLPTAKAKDLLPILLEMIVWSAEYDASTTSDRQIIAGGPNNLVARTRSARSDLIAEILSKLD